MARWASLPALALPTYHQATMVKKRKAGDKAIVNATDQHIESMEPPGQQQEEEIFYDYPSEDEDFEDKGNEPTYSMEADMHVHGTHDEGEAEDAFLPEPSEVAVEHVEISNSEQSKSRKSKRKKKDVPEPAGEAEGPHQVDSQTSPSLDKMDEDVSAEVNEAFEKLEPLRPPTQPAGKADKVQRTLPAWITNPRPISSEVAGSCTGDMCDRPCTSKDCINYAASPFPVEDAAWLSEKLKQTLSRQKIEYLFPVQAAVGPAICRGFESFYTPGDICVSAPTGSGKTLAYVLPILECLRKRVVRRLRCLVVLPTKDLVNQVRKTFESFVHQLSEGLPLVIGASTGQTAFTREQSQFVGDDGESKIDVLITTPGRLVDHVKGTAGFSLHHVRFLVVDEADRLLSQSYQEWLPTVLNALETDQSELLAVNCAASPPITVQRVLLSATLTHDPERLAALRLRRPRLFAAAAASEQDEGSRYTIPSSLQEFMVVCRAGEKPLALLHVLATAGAARTIVFTASLQATNRLCLLLQLCGVPAAEFSSALSNAQRSAVLRTFEAGGTPVLVCSDAMARGMDLRCVDYVVSYDAPAFIKTYIHRIGRTARAGTAGRTCSILKPAELPFFKAMRSKVDATPVSLIRVTVEDMAVHASRYQAALPRLQAIVKPSSKPENLKDLLMMQLQARLQAS